MAEEEDRFMGLEARMEAVEEATSEYIIAMRGEIDIANSEIQRIRETVEVGNTELSKRLDSVDKRLEKCEVGFKTPTPSTSRKRSILQLEDDQDEDDDDRVHTIPTVSRTVSFYCKKRVFEKPADFSIPTSFDELETSVKELISPFSKQMGVREKLTAPQHAYFAYMMDKYGGSDLTPEKLSTKIIRQGIEWKLCTSGWKPEGKSQDFAAFVKEKIKTLQKNKARMLELKKSAKENFQRSVNK